MNNYGEMTNTKHSLFGNCTNYLKMEKKFEDKKPLVCRLVFLPAYLIAATKYLH